MKLSYNRIIEAALTLLTIAAISSVILVVVPKATDVLNELISEVLQ